MPPKKNIKKLTLNKTTISNLNDLSMQLVHGGVQQADEAGDVNPVLPASFCHFCAASAQSKCLNSCFYDCDSSRQCIFPIDTAEPV